MPTIIRQGGFLIQIPTADHEPAHVHCVRDDKEIVVEIETLRIRRTRGNPKVQDIRAAVQIVAEHGDTLLKKWSEYHG